MTYRRDRSVREVYEERFMSDRPGRGQYSRGGERRGQFGRPDGYEYEGGPRFFPNGGGPRNYHGEDQRGYHGDVGHFPSERRGGPPSRREDYSYRGPREEQHTGRPMDYNSRAPPPPRNQGMYPAPRSLPESGADTLVQAILNLDRGDERQDYRRKAPPFPPPKDRSPHSRSGSSVSSRSYSPDRSKSLPFPSQQGKEKIPGLSREGSPSSATSNKEETNAGEAEKEEPPPAAVAEESHRTTADDFKEKRSLAIAAKAREIEKWEKRRANGVRRSPSSFLEFLPPLRDDAGRFGEQWRSCPFCLPNSDHITDSILIHVSHSTTAGDSRGGTSTPHQSCEDPQSTCVLLAGRPIGL
ncbi:periphilin-1 isoform X3 [Hippocampus zosterae]|uniref:periphilin-1 isoform X3 n=1 Tax=Hippocampus zosterae TaxID=109293 RepID=UPI00223E6DD8|nr:periphilin-1 isoform X3 [Hippocampus zosterae]